MDFNRAIAVLDGRESRKLCNNTYLMKCGEHGPHGGVDDTPPVTVCVRLHATHIITYRSDGSVVLNSGGWQTVTTKDRMNTYGPVRIVQAKGLWSFEYHGKTYGFSDGVTLYRDGIVAGAEVTAPKDQMKLRRQVKQYAKDFVAALDKGEVDRPSLGDCFYCQGMVSDLGGKPSTSADHLYSHMGLGPDADEVRYFVPSLLVKALAASGCSRVAHQWVNDKIYRTVPAVTATSYDNLAKEQVGKAISKYMLRALGQAA